MMKCLILCLFLATIVNIAYSRNVLERSKTCTKRDFDGTKIVSTLKLECTSCNGRDCSVFDTRTTTYPNGEVRGVGGQAYGYGCDYQLSC